MLILGLNKNHQSPTKNRLALDMKNIQQDKTEVADMEVVGHLFRLARTEKYRDVKSLREAARRDMPEVSEQLLTDSFAALAEILWQSDHGGYATEYKTTKLKNKARQGA